MKKVILKIMNGEYGSFYIDVKDRKLEKIEVINEKLMEINIPECTSEKFSYDRLEKIMIYYTKNENTDKTMEDVVLEIYGKGFFYPLNPSLEISVDIIQ